MTTGFRDPWGNDTDNLFTAGNAGITTGFKRSDGTDLGNLYHPYTTGEKRWATQMRNAAGTDLADLFQNSAVPLFAFTAANESVADHGVYDPPWNEGYATAGIIYYANGTTLLTASNDGNYSGTNWCSGDGTSKYVRLRSYSGDAPTGPSGWQQMNAQRNWYLSTSGGQTKYSTLTIDFSHDASNIARTVTVDLTAFSGF